MDIPLGVAEEGIKLAHCGVRPLITPGEAVILQMDLLELTVRESCPKMVYSASVDISLVFVSSLMYLVEIS